VDNGNGTSTLETKILVQNITYAIMNVLESNQLEPFCSGFLVAPDLVATAGHCVNPNNVTNILFVFGF